MIGIYGNKTDYIVSALVIMGGGRTILFICFAMFPVCDFYVSPVLSDVRFFFCWSRHSPVNRGLKKGGYKGMGLLHFRFCHDPAMVFLVPDGFFQKMLQFVTLLFFRYFVSVFHFDLFLRFFPFCDPEDSFQFQPFFVSIGKS